MLWQSIQAFDPQLNESDFKLIVKETIRATDKISLPDAELVSQEAGE